MTKITEFNKTAGDNLTTINIIDKDKAEELKNLGFKYSTQRVSDDKLVYVFINTPDLMKVLNGKFSQNKDFYIGKTLNF